MLLNDFCKVHIRLNRPLNLITEVTGFRQQKLR